MGMKYTALFVSLRQFNVYFALQSTAKLG